MIKRLSDLTKKQKAEWIRVNGVREFGKLVDDATSVKYIIESNTKEEIAEWLTKATTTFFDKSCAPYFCTVYEFNRLTEYCKEGEN